jgi:hypothetical protein
MERTRILMFKLPPVLREIMLRSTNKTVEDLQAMSLNIEAFWGVTLLQETVFDCATWCVKCLRQNFSMNLSSIRVQNVRPSLPNLMVPVIDECCQNLWYRVIKLCIFLRQFKFPSPGNSLVEGLYVKYKLLHSAYLSVGLFWQTAVSGYNNSSALYTIYLASDRGDICTEAGYLAICIYVPMYLCK